MKLLLLGAALLAPLACASASLEDGSPIATGNPRIRAARAMAFYSVVGRTLDELRSGLDHGGLPGPDGRFDARTSFQIDWHYGYAQDASGCRVGPLEIDLHMTTTLPRWEQDAEAADQVVQRWNGYISALQHHEQGHAELVTQAAAKVLAALEQLPARPTCAELSQDVDRTGKALVAATVADNGRYDTDTRHGATQGAVFP